MKARTLQHLWARFWMRQAGLSAYGRLVTRLATLGAPPYYGRKYLAQLNPHGYIAPGAAIHADLRRGAHVFIGPQVVIYQGRDGGPVELGDRAHLHDGVYIQTGDGGRVRIGSRTHIQPRCHFSAYLAPIEIGDRVLVAPNCAFYPYDHGTAPGEPIMGQPLESKGGIVVEDDAWLGFGVIVLSGVRIGRGAVVGAGSVVTHDIPDEAIAAGTPARVVRMRGETPGERTAWEEGDGLEGSPAFRPPLKIG